MNTCPPVSPARRGRLRAARGSTSRRGRRVYDSRRRVHDGAGRQARRQRTGAWALFSLPTGLSATYPLVVHLPCVSWCCPCLLRLGLKSLAWVWVWVWLPWQGPADYAAPVLARSPQSLDDLRKRFTRAKAKWVPSRHSLWALLLPLPACPGLSHGVFRCVMIPHPWNAGCG